MKSLSLRAKLLITFAASVLVISVGAGIVLREMRLSNDAYREVLERTVASEPTVRTMVTEFKKQVQEWKNVLLRGGDPKKLDKYWGKFEAREAAVKAHGETLLASLADEAQRERTSAFLTAHAVLGQRYREGLGVFRDAGFDAQAGDRAVQGIDREPTRLLDALADGIAEEVRAVTAARLADARRSELVGAGAMLLALVLGLTAFAWTVEVSVVRRARRLVIDLDRLAKGDLADPVHAAGTDELGALARSAESMRAALHDLLMQVNAAAGSLGQSADDVSQASLRAEEDVRDQQVQTDQVATAVHEMSATVQEVARNTAEAVTAAAKVREEGQTSKTVVGQTRQQIEQLAGELERAAAVIDRLSEDSERIGEVLDVIRGVAEQTNLLALNAAIEAARAGEQGRGFAVVADEVRALASRTQDSTQEIQAMIERLQAGAAEAVDVMSESRSRGGAAVEHAAEADRSLDAISTSSAVITDMSTQIAAATEQQSNVSAEVARSLERISEAARRAVERTTGTRGASERTATLAGELSAAVSRFRLE